MCLCIMCSLISPYKNYVRKQHKKQLPCSQYLYLVHERTQGRKVFELNVKFCSLIFSFTFVNNILNNCRIQMPEFWYFKERVKASIVMFGVRWAYLCGAFSCRADAVGPCVRRGVLKIKRRLNEHP